ncbi:FCD domain-containing protein [Frankia tisae]|uniref:FCD domain-containing protein n=1 Tax=Frankia tisae TaxID=2950104 RepID=UPI0021C1E316|nr:FCD domain-containing protein [Frankia tisae]
MPGDDGPVLGGAVEEGTPIPAAVVAVAAGGVVRPVWRNAFGGLTFELVGAPDRRFLKWAPAGSGLDLAAEAARLAWAAPFTAVPAVLNQGGDGAGSWLLTAGLPGRNAVEARWLADPGRAVQAVGAGLRALHDALPVASCPFSWSVADRLAAAAAAGGDGVDFVDADVALHVTVVAAAHNPVLDGLFAEFVPVLRRGLAELVDLLGLRAADPNHGDAAHAALVDAVAAGDGERAGDILRAELDETLTRLRAPAA